MQILLYNCISLGVRRLVVVTSYGCLGLRNHLINTRNLFSRVFMTGILKDKVLQEDIIQRESQYLDWTIVRPITLKDGNLTEKYWVSSEALPKTNKVKVLTRKDLAHYILTIINRPQEYKTIRSIAGRPRNLQPTPPGGFEKTEKRLL
jgi:putative NADH-flavin reductase